MILEGKTLHNDNYQTEGGGKGREGNLARGVRVGAGRLIRRERLIERGSCSRKECLSPRLYRIVVIGQDFATQVQKRMH